ncbi:nuclear transport factor 2 family protein [Tistrella sp. BH-R2-4]|uniref:Nuclear transport factor 2 family protein n=1 Tax=Tistrella arctica TaxID=3133430 RepID=A0ABU9YMX2_9PROT
MTERPPATDAGDDETPARRGLAAWCTFFETLSPATLDRIDALSVPDLRFVDPFNDVTGRERVRALLAHMFQTLDAPRFVVLHQACDGDIGLIRWRFTARRSGQAAGFTIEGMSEVRLAGDGRVIAHIDHWDAAGQIYERVPVLGFVLRRIRARLAAPVAKKPRRSPPLISLSPAVRQAPATSGWAGRGPAPETG